MESKTKVKIGEKEFELKYTLGAWKRLKKEHDITPSNFQEKIQEDMAGAVSALVFFGLSPEDRDNVSIDELDECLEFNVIDIVSKAVIAGLPERTEGEEKGKSDDAKK